MDGEFWLGNEILHNLTDAEGKWTIRLELTNEDNIRGFFLKKQFHVGPGHYKLFLENSEIQLSGMYTWHCIDQASPVYIKIQIQEGIHLI